MQTGRVVSMDLDILRPLMATLVAWLALKGLVPAAMAEEGAPAEASVAQPAADTQLQTAAKVDVDADTDDSGPADDVEREAKAPPAVGAQDESRYTAEMSDADLAERFVSDLPSLGSIAVGLAEEGRVINAVQLATSAAVQVAVPEYAWATQETVDSINRVADAVRDACPDGPPLRVSHIGKKNGGFIHGHFSHQSGRDVDLGFYYKPGVDPPNIRGRREELIDPVMSWALLRALVTEADVQLILVDRRIQSLLYAQALGQGEDKAWLDSLFRSSDALVRHARRHRDHFHVRFFSPRAQELGRRVQPILAKRPDENVAIYRVRSGDTLSHIAQRYGSTVSLIQGANGMRTSFLSIGRTLVVPLRGPCTRCPLPPPVVVPERRLPPACSAKRDVQSEPAGGL